MEILDRKKQLVEEISDRQKELNKINLQILNEIGESVSEYLENNTIGGQSFKMKDASMGSFYDQVEIKLLGVFGEREIEPDESFESDSEFRKFLTDLASKYNLRRVAVPHYYYHK